MRTNVLLLPHNSGTRSGCRGTSHVNNVVLQPEHKNVPFLRREKYVQPKLTPNPEKRAEKQKKFHGKRKIWSYYNPKRPFANQPFLLRVRTSLADRYLADRYLACQTWQASVQYNIISRQASVPEVKEAGWRKARGRLRQGSPRC